MFGNSHKVKQEEANEQLRLTLAIAIIAATIGIFTLDSEKHTFVVILRGFTLLPSLMLGLYMIFTAAHLKYKKVGEMGDLSVPEKLRRWCYDTSVNLFWYMLILFTLIFIAELFGWDGDTKNFLKFWPSFVVSFVVLGALIIFTYLISKKENQKLPLSKKTRRLKIFWRIK